jgi:DNA polymerase-3 subunit beta
MKIQIKRKDLFAGLQQVHGVVEKRNTMPILSHVLISATGAILPNEENGNTPTEANISLFATDLEIGICDHYPASVITPGKVTAPANKFFEIVRKLPDGVIDIEQLDNHWISIESGNSYFKMAGLAPEEFPALTLSEGDVKITVDAVLLTKLIRKTLFAVGENDSRYILNGLLLQIQKINEAKSQIRFVATDGHRLALADGVIKRTAEKLLEEQVILPKKAILEIKRILSDAKGGESEEEPAITFGKGLLTFKYKTTILSSRLMNGNYPNYQQVIPNNNDKKISVNKFALTGALERVSILSQEKTDTIKMSVDSGQIILRSNNPELGEAREAVETSSSCEPFETLFSARYLMDLLSVLEEENVVFEFKDATSSCLVREDAGKFLSIIMPLKE